MESKFANLNDNFVFFSKISNNDFVVIMLILVE